MIVHVDVERAGVQLWSPDDIREDLGHTGPVGEDQRGILLATGEGRDGVLLVGTEDQLIDRLERTIALIRRERRIIEHGGGLPYLRLGDQLTDGQCEMLRDRFAAAAAGDADWTGGATYLHNVDRPREVDGVVILPGTYLRTVEGGQR